MSLFGQQKSGPGLSINTSAANSGGNSLFGAGGGQTATTGGLFGNTAKSQPQALGGLSGNTNQTSQPQSSGGLFGGSTQQSSQPAQGGGLFSNLGSTASSQPQASGGLLGNTQPAQAGGGGLFGNTQNTTSSQPAQSGGLFGNVGKPQPQQSTGFFGATNASQPQQTSSLFGGNQTQPASTQAQPSGFSLGGLGAKSNNANTGSLLGSTSLAASTAGNQATNQSSSVKINIEHLRTTTRFEQLTDDLQKEIELLDTFILQQMTFSHEVSDLLPAVAAGGVNVPNDVTFISDKLEELELGLENDATEINSIKDKVVAKDAAEAKLCFRGVDRLKMPAQYQQQQLYQSVNGTSAGGLSGWWNHPQTLQRSVRGASSNGGRRNLQLPGDDDEESKGPSNLVDFFENRAAEMNETLGGYKNIMRDIEAHLDGVEMSIAMKQRELNDSRSSGGVMGRGADEKVRNLRYALGVFEKSIYDVAEQIGTAREGVQELGIGRVQSESRLGSSRLAW